MLFDAKKSGWRVCVTSDPASRASRIFAQDSACQLGEEQA